MNALDVLPRDLVIHSIFAGDRNIVANSDRRFQVTFVIFGI